MYDLLTTVEFVAGLGAVDLAVTTALHRDAGPVLARELTLRTLDPFFRRDKLSCAYTHHSLLFFVRQKYMYMASSIVSFSIYIHTRFD